MLKIHFGCISEALFHEAVEAVEYIVQEVIVDPNDFFGLYYFHALGAKSGYFITILHGWDGVSRDPNFALHNIWTEVTSGRCLSLATILKVVFI